jgi:hypothetical protein
MLLRYLLATPILCGVAMLVLGQPAAAQPSPDHPALVIIVDNSDSMNDNDPTNLRYAATRLVLDVADDGDMVGVSCFGYQTAELVPLEPLGDRATRLEKAQRATRDTCSTNGGTAMHTAIEQAITTLDRSPATRKFILLLTDGVPNYPGSPDYEPSKTLAALNSASRAGITVIPVALYTQQLDQYAQDFLTQLRALKLMPQTITRNIDLIALFAKIYSSLKPDLYVALLQSDISRVQISQAQQVTQLRFVLPTDLALTDQNGAQISCTQAIEACQTDIQGQYQLLNIDQSRAVGMWQIAGDQPAVVIARSNFQPSLAYPPGDDAQQTSYYYPRSGAQTLIAKSSSASVSTEHMTINGADGTIAPGERSAYQINQFPQQQQEATLTLGSRDVPLIVSKHFQLQPIPDAQPTLPHLETTDDHLRSIAKLETDTKLRLAVPLAGDQTLIRSINIYALAIDTSNNRLVIPPQPLQLVDGTWQSGSTLAVQPGARYRVLAWLDAVRQQDGLRYGDQIDVTIKIPGVIKIAGLHNLALGDLHGADLPLTVSITEPERSADLSVKLTWIQQPPEAQADRYFSILLQDSTFASQPTGTTLQLHWPTNECDLIEGTYQGRIEFSSDSGLPVVPASVDISGTVDHGNLRVVTAEAVDLGTFCATPFLCMPFGDEPIRTARLTAELPSCGDPKDVQAKVDSITSDDRPQVIFGELRRASTMIEQELSIRDVPATISPFHQEFVGKVLIGLRSKFSASEFAQFRYAKRSLFEALLQPWPFPSEPWRVGNIVAIGIWLIAACLGMFLLIKIWHWLFGSSRDSPYFTATQPTNSVAPGISRRASRAARLASGQTAGTGQPTNSVAPGMSRRASRAARLASGQTAGTGQPNAGRRRRH